MIFLKKVGKRVGNKHDIFQIRELSVGFFAKHMDTIFQDVRDNPFAPIACKGKGGEGGKIYLLNNKLYKMLAEDFEKKQKKIKILGEIDIDFTTDADDPLVWSSKEIMDF